MNESERQRIVDEEHLKLLRIGYIVAGVFDAVVAFLPLIYVLVGVLIAATAPGPSRPGEPNPAFIGVIFAIVGICFSLFLGAQAALKLFAARAIGKRKQRMLCYVAAGLSCLQFPWGTILGVFTFMALSRPSVERMFAGDPPARIAAPPERYASSLFDDEPAARPYAPPAE